MKNSVFLFMFMAITISCEKNNYNQVKTNFIASYGSLDFRNFNSERNTIELPKTKGLLHDLGKASKGNQGYFVDLMWYRIFLIENRREEALSKLKSIEKINPMMFHVYRGVVYELLDKNLEKSKSEFTKAMNYCEEPFFKLFLNYLVENEIKTYLDGLEDLDSNLQKIVEGDFQKYGNDNYRRESIAQQFLSTYYLPEE